MTDTIYPADAGPGLFLLTVLGTPTTGSGANARELHNQTAGNPGGVAGAKALGDLSHNVFLPAVADDARLLFVDNWNSPTGLGQFFTDEQVLQGAAALWTDREAVLWAPAADFGSYHLPVPSGSTVAAIGLMRAPLSSVDAARPAFHADSMAKINASRQFGMIAHELWLPAPMPGSTPTTEVLGVDYWLDVDQMNAWYAAATYDEIGATFTGAPATSTWVSAGPKWIEW
ncbi:hypothetical protein BH09ACT4_BH09ACT4_25730 [soil metagenome]